MRSIRVSGGISNQLNIWVLSRVPKAIEATLEEICLQLFPSYGKGKESDDFWW